MFGPLRLDKKRALLEQEAIIEGLERSFKALGQGTRLDITTHAKACVAAAKLRKLIEAEKPT